jgi:hypothetical protein
MLKVTTTYTDINGQSYGSSFELTFPVVPRAAAARRPQPHRRRRSPHRRAAPTPQLLVTGYTTEPETLQPGLPFTLTMDVSNEDRPTPATSSSSSAAAAPRAGIDGTPEPGGVSGAGGSFTSSHPLARRTSAGWAIWLPAMGARRSAAHR